MAGAWNFRTEGFPELRPLLRSEIARRTAPNDQRARGSRHSSHLMASSPAQLGYRGMERLAVGALKEIRQGPPFVESGVETGQASRWVRTTAVLTSIHAAGWPIQAGCTTSVPPWPSP